MTRSTTRRLCAALCLTSFLTAVALGGDGKPKRTPSPTTDAHRTVVNEGTALHDQGDYTGAIEKYESVLAESPDDVLPQYELAYTLLAKKDYQKSLEVARHGAEYVSGSLGEFYVLIGTNLDMLGKPDDAIKAYEAGIKLAPDTMFLYFNLAVTELKQDKVDEARKNLKLAVTLKPNFPSAHFLLARTFFAGGYKVPALFAAARFLTLEPDSERASTAIDIVNEVLRGGLRPGAKPNEFTINLDLGGKKDEGDFDSVAAMIGISSAAKTLPESKGKTEAQLLSDQWDLVLELASGVDDKKTKSSFTYRYYMPYFTGLKANKLVEPFVYYTMQSSSTPGVGTWLMANDARAKEFLAWSGKFPWPRDVKP